MYMLFLGLKYHKVPTKNGLNFFFRELRGVGRFWGTGLDLIWIVLYQHRLSRDREFHSYIITTIKKYKNINTFMWLIDYNCTITRYISKKTNFTQQENNDNYIFLTNKEFKKLKTLIFSLIILLWILSIKKKNKSY